MSLAHCYTTRMFSVLLDPVSFAAAGQTTSLVGVVA